MGHTYIKVAGLTFLLDYDGEVKLTEAFYPFLIMDNSMFDYRISFQRKTELAINTSLPVYRDLGYCVYPDKKHEFIKYYFLDEKMEKHYATSWINREERMVNVEYLEKGTREMKSVGALLFYSHWEELLLRENRILFHACAIDTPFGAILFSGPSGIGKSTQGRLWNQYEDAVEINGDRPILWQKDGKWTAFGSPYAGSSECHRNTSAQIACIVMLKQAKSCSLKRLNMAQAFQKVFSQITVNTYDRNAVDHGCNLVMDIISEIPVYELSCTPTREAVEILKKQLEEGKE